jgi:hypothetical protein
MALPCGTTGSLWPGFPPARPVGLAVKLSYAIALYARFPFGLREPLRASVTLWEATAPVKLPGYSYGRRLPGLRFAALLALTTPLNLPAPGRRQTLYVALRLRRVLCFW